MTFFQSNMYIYALNTDIYMYIYVYIYARIYT